MKKNGDDPLGKKAANEISKSSLDEILLGDDAGRGCARPWCDRRIRAGAGLCHAALLPKTKGLGRYGNASWSAAVSVPESRVGELVIARTDIILKAEDLKVTLVPIRFHPDEAGLIGCLHLAPSWIFEGYDSILAVDIGGSNIRCGVVETAWKKSKDLSKASVWKSDLWKHADDEPTREGAVKRLVKMLKDLISAADNEGLKLAPFIGISCPGGGGDQRRRHHREGAQNLPGNWESSKFNLPALLAEGIPTIGDHDTAVLMHNDGVVQGLSEVPFMQDFRTMGRADDRNGPGQCSLHQPQEREGRQESEERQGLSRTVERPVAASANGRVHASVGESSWRRHGSSCRASNHSVRCRCESATKRLAS